MKKTITLTFLSILLSGCATRTMSTQDIGQFKELSLNQFLVERFVNTEKSSFVDGVTSSLDTVANASDSLHKNRYSPYKAEKRIEDFDKATTGLLQDGKSVSFNAYFTNMNYAQLTRPVKEIASFCTVQGGQLHVVNLGMKDFIQEAVNNPFKAYLKSMDINYSGYKEMNPFSGDEAKFKLLFKGIKKYLTRGYLKNTDLNAYRSAMYSKAFGLFQCGEIGVQKVKWYVSISPFSYEYPMQYDDLTSASLRIFITPIQN